MTDSPPASRDPTTITAAPRTDSRVIATHGHGFIIATTAFLTLIDLFAVQSVLPNLALRFQVSASEIAVAANACTLGMALASLATAIWGGSINRRVGIAASLTLLALPTTALAFAPDLATFSALRIVQGALMATAFTLMLAHLGEHFCPISRPIAFAAFVTGNVLSNFLGRIISANVADLYGIPITFFAFAGLNVAGALLVYFTVRHTPDLSDGSGAAISGFGAVTRHLAQANLRAAFLTGFLILFAFIGVFSFVNFVLARPPIGLSTSEIGWVYLVFVPALPTTLLMGRLIRRYGARAAILAMLLVAMAGLPFLALGNLPAALAGLTLVAIGTFAAQAGATGFVSSNATFAKSTASGLYLAAYFSGGIVGSWILGMVFEQGGWNACLVAIGLALALAGLVSRRLK